MELAGVSMMLGEALLLGIAVPVVLPLACIGVLSNLAAVHLATTHLGVEFKNEAYARVGWWYLAAAVSLNTALLFWFFVTNAGLSHAARVVYFAGAPLGTLLGAWAGVAWRRRQDKGLPDSATRTPAEMALQQEAQVVVDAVPACLATCHD
jgi:hypothetical protein